MSHIDCLSDRGSFKECIDCVSLLCWISCNAMHQSLLWSAHRTDQLLCTSKPRLWALRTLCLRAGKGALLRRELRRKLQTAVRPAALHESAAGFGITTFPGELCLWTVLWNCTNNHRCVSNCEQTKKRLRLFPHAAKIHIAALPVRILSASKTKSLNLQVCVAKNKILTSDSENYGWTLT